MFEKFSFSNLIRIYNKNKPVFDAYLNRHSIEGFDYEDSNKVVHTKIENIPIWIVILFIILHLIIIVLAVYTILLKWKIMPEWAKSVSIICLIFNMPILAFIFAYGSTMKIKEEKSVSV